MGRIERVGRARLLHLEHQHRPRQRPLRSRVSVNKKIDPLVGRLVQLLMGDEAAFIVAEYFLI